MHNKSHKEFSARKSLQSAFDYIYLRSTSVKFITLAILSLY